MKYIAAWLIITGLMAACVLPSYFMQSKPAPAGIENGLLLPTEGSVSIPPTPIFTPSQPIQETKQPLPTQEELIKTLLSLNFDRYLVDYTTYQTPKKDSPWISYRFDAGDMQCIRGGETFVMVREGAKADNTVFWMAGGGSCYPGRDDCIKEARFLNSIERNDLASTDIANPFRSWNFIYLPYCDGSIHLGIKMLIMTMMG